jgi:transposase
MSSHLIQRIGIVISNKNETDAGKIVKDINRKEMAHSIDLRERVIEYIEKGGSVTKAAKVYRVSRASIYRWQGREELEATKVTRRKRKLDWEALKKDTEENPSEKLADRGKKFGVTTTAIWYAVKEMKITRKKNS